MLCILTGGATGKFHCRTTCWRSLSSLKVLFIGSDELVSLPVLKFLHLDYPGRNSEFTKIRSLDVLTRVNKQNLNPVAQYSLQNNLPVLNWDDFERDESFGSLSYDLGVLSSFGKLIPLDLINATDYGIINVHPSLLPRWRGSSPLPRTILSGDEISGVSLMLLEPRKFDIGRILDMRKFDVPRDVTTPELAAIALNVGTELLSDCLDNLITRVENAQPQDSEGVTYAYKLKPSDALINWHSHCVEDIWRMYRALSFKYTLSTTMNGKKLKLADMLHPNLTIADHIPWEFVLEHKEPGTACFASLIDAVCVRCRDGFVGFRKLTLSGRKVSTPLEFSNGYLNSSDILKFS